MTNEMPTTLWLTSEERAKLNGSHKDSAAVEYVRADVYDELIAWAQRVADGLPVCRECLKAAADKRAT